MPPYTRDLAANDQVKWSAEFEVPEIGTDILVRINGIGRAKVVGYATQDGYLGVMCEPYNPPDWWVRQNGLPGPANAALAFGAEISRIQTGEGA
ncbi:hypothetical protein [Variovorax sp. EL159]|uniref:hypothetical protein n=1 Tax=Variovorax sp. EL159 TaxID=1566270 RepID=UPI00210D5623|nr:hypothetical protein [Variovorax sp. EL159]